MAKSDINREALTRNIEDLVNVAQDLAAAWTAGSLHSAIYYKERIEKVLVGVEQLIKDDLYEKARSNND